MVKAGFTLIELLVVISIIAVLTGMTLASLPAVRATLKRQKSQTILTTIRIALETTSAVTGTRPSPAPHPLAGSAAPRSLFRRGGTALDVNGEALEVDKIAWVATASHGLVLQPDDRFAGRIGLGDCPALFGMPRSRLGIVGVASMTTRHHRRLPSVSPLTDTNPVDGILDIPYTAAKYPDRLHLVSAGLTVTVTNAGTGYTGRPLVAFTGGGGSGTRATAIVKDGKVVGVTMESPGSGYTGDPTVAIAGGGGTGATAIAERTSDIASRLAIEQAIGLIGRDEAMSLGALFSTTDANYLFDALLWTDGSVSPYWLPGHVQAGGWRRYRLRGTALYDSYGTEILYSVTNNGAIRLECAGRDGLFLWKPGAAGYAFSDLLGEPPADRNASVDNVTLVTRE